MWYRIVIIENYTCMYVIRNSFDTYTVSNTLTDGLNPNPCNANKNNFKICTDQSKYVIVHVQTFTAEK